MTRTNSALISVLAILAVAFAATPALASESYSSVNALTGDQTVQPYGQSKDYSSANAITGGTSKDQTAQPNPYSTVNSITGGAGTDVSPQPSRLVDVREDGGFDWGDALIGALVASGLLGLAFVAARSVARHRRAATEPRV
jgi:hypothetical protein